MATVVLVGTLDTKGEEYAFLRDRIRDAGAEVLLVDTGVLGDPQVEADFSRQEVAAAAGTSLHELVRQADRGAAMEAMGRGASVLLGKLRGQRRLDAVAAAGGSGNASIAARAVQDLPVGVPKLIVSTLAAGDTRPYIGTSDVTMMYPVVDIAGVNAISARVLSNAAAAIAAMAGVSVPEGGERRPLIGATMFGVTTPCVTSARKRLEDLGYEVLVFHATGVGGRSLEALIGSGYLVGVLDVTTTELADELVGGELSAGDQRLTAAGKAGIPQVVSLGALDMVNFGPRDSVPPTFQGRDFYAHNPAVTLMRTTAEEMAQLGDEIARKLNVATGPTAVFLPLAGVSAIDAEDQPFFAPQADAALFDALRAKLDRERVELHELQAHINDHVFATAMADCLHGLVTEAV